jgi:hypothetical protein
MQEIMAQLHTAAFMSLGKIEVSEEQMEALAQKFTRKVEFLHPRYGLMVWMKNKQIFSETNVPANQQKEEMASCPSSAYPFLTRQLERKYGPRTAQRRFDGNKSPHRAFSLSRAGTCTHGAYKKGKELEHIIDGKDYGVPGDVHFSCLFSICLIPDTIEKVADQSFFIRFLLRARSLFLLSNEINLLREQYEALNGVEAEDVLKGWGPYAARATGVLKSFVEDDANWSPMKEFSQNNLNKLLKDRGTWKPYTDTMEDEGYGLAWLQGGQA